MTARFALGIDVGGTSIRAAIVDNLGRIAVQSRRKTPAGMSAQDLVELILDLQAKLFRDASFSSEKLRAIGLALPGLIDSSTGRVIRSVNLPGLEGHSPAIELEKRTGIPAFVLLDRQGNIVKPRNEVKWRTARFFVPEEVLSYLKDLASTK